MFNCQRLVVAPIESGDMPKCERKFLQKNPLWVKQKILHEKTVL